MRSTCQGEREKDKKKTLAAFFAVRMYTLEAKSTNGQAGK